MDLDRSCIMSRLIACWKYLTRRRSRTECRAKTRRRPRTMLSIDALESRQLLSTLIVLDFNGATREDLEQVCDRMACWPDHPTTHGLVGFVQGFALLGRDHTWTTGEFP